MTLEDIRQLIADDESRHLELKKTTGELKDGMHTACAFLNGEGGWLIFGVSPKTLRITGQTVNDNTQREIALALSGFEPMVDAQVQYVDVDEHSNNKVIAIYFEAFVWGKQPYTYHGCPYIKVESTKKVMPREMFEERLRAHKPNLFAWELQRADGIDLNGLDEERLRGALRLGFEKGRVNPSALTESSATVLEKLGLMTDGKLNNAAAALFATDVKRFPQFRLRMARFLGTDKNEFIDNQRVDGNFFVLLDAGMSFFLKHLSISGTIVGFKREESLEIPAEALREALTNALCHRQFEKYNLTPSIAIYDDRIEIENPGKLPQQLTVTTIKQPHNSYPYNPIMADVLFKTTFLENWGTGVRRIIDVCKSKGVPEPVWSVNGGFVCVTFRRFYRQNEPEAKYEPSTNQVRTKYEPSTSQVEKLILRMSEEYMSANEMMITCGLKNRMRFRTAYIVPALTENAIERRYPENPNHPRQRYRLTEQAKEWKDGNINESKR